jgi:hypothetical protein
LLKQALANNQNGYAFTLVRRTIVRSINQLTVLLCVLQLLNVGCTALQSFPNAARAGDTVALAIGSPDGMDKTNTTAVYVSQSDPNYVPISDPSYPGSAIQHPLGIRSIFKLYADKASEQYQLNNLNTNIVSTSGHEAWVTIAAIDLPTTLPTGFGEVLFSSPTSTYPTVGSHIDNVPVSLEVLPAAGSGTPDNYAAIFPYELGVGASSTGDLSTLEPQEHSVIFPEFQGTPGPYGTTYGAIELEIDLKTSRGTSLPQRAMRALVDDMTPKTGSSRSVSYSLKSNGVDGSTLKVLIISPEGKLTYYEPRITIVLNPPITFTSTPTINTVNYYNVDGGPATGPAIAQYNVELR